MELSQEDIELGHKKILETLRTTQLPQTFGVLAWNGTYCAIGALAKEAGATFSQLDTGMLRCVMEETYAMTGKDSRAIMLFNDREKLTFPEIADRLERYWDGRH